MQGEFMTAGYLLAGLFLVSSFFIQDAQAAEKTREVVVSAAASLKNAFVEIGRFYSRSDRK
jgi:ABC-type molybdate transport system substrate-binding protein